jgi:hypothetical protein
MDDRDLMRVHIEALFIHDANGRLVVTNNPGRREAPRFFLGRTSHGVQYRFRADVSDDIARELSLACSEEPTGMDEGPPRARARYLELLERAAPIQREWIGPAYYFPSGLEAQRRVEVISDRNADLLGPHFARWHDDFRLAHPFVALVQDGCAVSVCCSARITTTADEAGVETAEAFRGNGYAPIVVTAWAVAVRELGRMPLYSTSWQNTASRSVATKLGLVQYGSDFHAG